MFLETLIISCHVCEDRKGIPRIVHTYDQSKNYFIERKKSFSFFLTDGGIRKKICRINGEELKTNKKEEEKKNAETRIRTWVTAATTQCPNH